MSLLYFLTRGYFVSLPPMWFQLLLIYQPFLYWGMQTCLSRICLFLAKAWRSCDPKKALLDWNHDVWATKHENLLVFLGSWWCWESFNKTSVTQILTNFTTFGRRNPCRIVMNSANIENQILISQGPFGWQTT